MRRSSVAAAAALRACIAATHAGLTERDLSALFQFRTAVQGAQSLSYTPVAAAGANACTIHYCRADSRLESGDVMLMDAGCELHGYASDVTRTWPVSGRFTAEQRAVYDAVARTHAACLAALRPGATLRAVHQLSVDMLADAARDLGLQGPVLQYYPHSVGHWLGLDTHDCGHVRQNTPLEPGVTLALEPGLYLRGAGVPPGLQGVGVRLEDDVVITEGGAEVLSAGVPLQAEAVEELVGSAAAAWPALAAGGGAAAA